MTSTCLLFHFTTLVYTTFGAEDQEELPRGSRQTGPFLLQVSFSTSHSHLSLTFQGPQHLPSSLCLNRTQNGTQRLHPQFRTLAERAERVCFNPTGRKGDWLFLASKLTSGTREGRVCRFWSPQTALGTDKDHVVTGVALGLQLLPTPAAGSLLFLYTVPSRKPAWETFGNLALVTFPD